jgi:predicted nucleotidyltransferase
VASGHIMKQNGLEKLKILIIQVLRLHGVKRAALFGSAARGELTRKSDVDVLVDLGKGKSLMDLVGLKLDLEEALEKKVDVITYNSIHPLLKERILKDQQVLF